MREILFRGKTFNDEWVEGALVKWSKAHSIIRKYGSDTIGLYEYSVVPETLGQYTGLTDKNGKKIFEGDIILIDFDGFPVYKREVSFNQDVSAYVLWNGTKSKFYPMSEAPKKYSKVIGNIYDNFELLGGGKK